MEETKTVKNEDGYLMGKRGEEDRIEETKEPSLDKFKQAKGRGTRNKEEMETENV